MLDPSLWDNPKFREIIDASSNPHEFEAVLCHLIGLISSCADDYGRFQGSEMWIRSNIYKFKDIPNEEVRRRNFVLENKEIIISYSSNRVDYYYFPNWFEWQALDRPRKSHIPAPPQPAKEHLVPRWEKYISDCEEHLPVDFRQGKRTTDYGPNWEAQKRFARKRDNFTCRICGKTTEQNGRSLDVVHVIPFQQFQGDWGKANDLRNLVSLCTRCRIDVTKGEVELTKLFKDQLLPLRTLFRSPTSGTKLE